jgi:hypothetical protein
MKHFCLVLFLCTIGLVACKKESGPRPVAEDFLNAMRSGDYEEAAKYGTEETIKLLRQFEKIEQLNGEESDAEKSGEITIVSEDIKGKSATVYFLEKGNPIEQHISLIKVEEKGRSEWKVALKKEEIKLMQEKPVE